MDLGIATQSALKDVDRHLFELLAPEADVRLLDPQLRRSPEGRVDVPEDALVVSEPLFDARDDLTQPLELFSLLLDPSDQSVTFAD